MLNFPTSVIRQLIRIEKAELGEYKDNQFVSSGFIYAGKDFTSFMTDIVYTQYVTGKAKNDECRVTLGDEHITINSLIVNDDRIYKKDYIWHFERESRFVIQLLLSSEDRKTMMDRLYRSPLYCGKVDYGKQSACGKLNFSVRKSRLR